MSRLTPICVPCARSMRCAENEVAVRDKRTSDSPSTVWSGDRFECPGCGASVIVDFGRGRVEDPAAPSEALEFRR
jgi:hypothetical protein